MEVHLMLDTTANPVIGRIQAKYGQQWSLQRFISDLPVALGDLYKTKLHKIAAHQPPFDINLHLPFRMHRTYNKDIYTVALGLSSPVMESLLSEFKLGINAAVQQEEQLLG
jgi:hypothetical protein